MSQNYIMQIEYLGKNYSGWQKQKHSNSVQEEIEKVLSKITNHNVDIICAGRTDAGVHATSQIINFYSDSNRDIRSILNGSNGLLPHDIKVMFCDTVSDDFNARFSANNRTYNYIIHNSEYSSPLVSMHTLWERRKLDIDKMNQAAEYIRGELDFSSFRSSQCQSKTAKRNILKADFRRKNDFIIFEVKGNAFLHHMIRNFVGSFLEVGLGKKDPTWIRDLIEIKDRNNAGKTAKPQGLYFVGAEYPEFDFFRKVPILG